MLKRHFKKKPSEEVMRLSKEKVNKQSYIRRYLFTHKIKLQYNLDLTI